MGRAERESLAEAWREVTAVASLWKRLVVLGAILSSAFGAGAAGAHWWLAKDITAAVQVEHEASGARWLELAKQRMSDDEDLKQYRGWIESQIVEDYRARVRLQAAIAEPDWRKRESVAGAAELAFDKALHGWPCEPDPDRPGYKQRCVTPEHAARIALEIRPSR